MRATTLDKLYFDSNQNLLKECLNTFLQDVEYSLANKKTEDALIDDILRDDTPINATLYDVYSKNLRKAVDKVFYEDNGNGLSDCLRANVTRFAAYKAYHATQQVREQIAKDGDMDRGRMVLHAFNRYQAAEYNTTVSRCRTAKQFEEFSAADNMRLFPNLRWLPSRSANPREQHMLFYNRVWAKDDPFWVQNQPGNLWNCKCDWEETSDPVTDGNPTAPIRHDGLEGNPAHTGEIFTDNCAYVKHSGQNRKERDKVEEKCRRIHEKETTKQGKLFLKEHCITKEIDGDIYEFDFNNFKYRANGMSDKVDICRHFSRSMFGDKNYWLKNEILLSPQRYMDKSHLKARADIDHHNTGAATIALKEATERFFYFETTLANGEKIILHVGRYKVSQKLYLYAASKMLPEYVENPQ